MTTRTAVAPHPPAPPEPQPAEVFPPPRTPLRPARWLAVVAADAAELRRFWPVILNLVSQELRVRYHRSVLGFCWTLLNPILMMTVMAMVFSQLMPQGDEPSKYAIYLFSGMVPWTFLAGSLTESAYCIISNEGLIRKIYIPKLVFPLTRILTNLTTFVLSMGALFLLLVPMGARFSAPLLFLPVAVLLLAVFTLGLGLILATLNTFYRDCGHLVSVFLQAWYFATPIIYRLSIIRSPVARRRFWLNPAYPFVRLFQTIIDGQQWPDLFTLSLAAGIATVSLGVGYVAFKSHEDKLVFRL
ncbi:MAG TPA: ABC transporter permease [Isosphaeraceae bacterium]|jgi:ABC-type polysaccharide/polyol phosphate export permease|nr:ABC transporter permease [Isosphaeraceae bacterium]